MVEGHGAQEWVVCCNALATQAGIQPGMKRSAASTLLGSLRFLKRQAEQEAQTLAHLAGWAQQFTPAVSIALPCSLLLEISGSLDYFHGLDALIEQVQQGLATYEMAVQIGCAITPLAATWLALAGIPTQVTDMESLALQLGQLAVDILPIPLTQRQQLRRLGIDCLSALIRLPRAGLARRFGPALSTLLDQALGKQPDPRPCFQPPAYFEKRIELAWPIEETEPLLFIGRQLAIALANYLQGLNRGVLQVRYQLEHGNHTTTTLDVGHGQPTRQAAVFVAVLRERLASFSLPAPIEAVTLMAAQLEPLAGRNLDIFTPQQHAASSGLLHARLAARLGQASIKQITSVDEHRPERAWALGKPTAAPMPQATQRPTWLIAPPLPLTQRHHQLWHTERLFHQGLPERIEAGWWDDERVTRDYWIAQGASGQRYWIFQERETGNWFLHGVFD